MNIAISLVPPGQLTYWLGLLFKYLKKSEEWTKGRANIDDIVRFIYSGTMQLWVFFEPDTDEVYGHMITEIKAYPKSKTLVLQYCAGEPGAMQYVETRMHDVVVSFAKDSGCDRVEFIGRPGWKRSALSHGYELEACVYTKKV